MTKDPSEFISTTLSGIWLHEPVMFADNRGTTSEIFNISTILSKFGKFEVSQILEARSSFGVIRGIHYSASNNPQIKIVRCTQGKILDCVIDLRPNSISFGKYEMFSLDSKSPRSLIISPGFGHGYQILSKDATVLYALNTNLNFSHEHSIYPLDNDLSLPWADIPAVLSDRDSSAPRYREVMELDYFNK